MEFAGRLGYVSPCCQELIELVKLLSDNIRFQPYLLRSTHNNLCILI